MSGSGRSDDAPLSAPVWACRLLSRLAGPGRAGEVIGDLEESHRERVARRGRLPAHVLTGLEALDVAVALLRDRRRRRAPGASFAAEARGRERARAGLSWLDFKLGLRMLVKHPGLSAVSVVGMSVAIAIGAGYFEFIGSMLDSRLPLPEGDRVVSLLNRTGNAGDPERRSLHDFLVWRGEVRSVRELSAFADRNRNLVVPTGAVELVNVAEMTASGFALARTQPLLGRTLLEEDERPGATPVIVIAYEEWQRHFDGDPGALGQQVQLGGQVHTVVGVMPAGFRFPLHHRYWVPLRLSPAPQRVGEGPVIHIFGRLAPGTTLESAQAELTTIGRRMAAAFPETHEDLRPLVAPYTHPFLFDEVASSVTAWVLRAVQLALSLLLIVVSVNVAILVYARTAARTGEIAVRTALGASRRRVVAQLFIEALVVSAIAAAVGLAVAAAALRLVADFWAQANDDAFALPFWLDFTLSPPTIFYTAGLAVLAGAIVGVLPALKVTGRGMHERLQQLSARGSQIQLGRTWTALIVVQVAIAVAALPFAVTIAGKSVERGTARAGYATGELLHTWLAMERDGATDSAAAHAREARFLERTQELLRRLEAEPGVAAITFASSFPGLEGSSRIEVEGIAAPRWVRTSRVEVDYFADIGVRVLAGRGFVAADSAGGAQAAVVDRVFVDQMLGGGDALGRRIRQITWRRGAAADEFETGPWLEIVGIVPTFAVQPDFDAADPRIYLPVPLGDAPAVAFSVRLPGDGAPARFAPRLRTLTAAVDPDLQLRELRTATEAERQLKQSLLLIAILVSAVIGSVLLLSAAGIYAMMSFTVVRRRREIGIRVALGANRWRVLRGVFARAAAQLGMGALIGLGIAAALDRVVGGGPFSGEGLRFLPVIVAIVFAVGLLAALGPARRGLAVQPTEALRQE